MDFQEFSRARPGVEADFQSAKSLRIMNLARPEVGPTLGLHRRNCLGKAHPSGGGSSATNSASWAAEGLWPLRT